MKDNNVRPALVISNDFFNKKSNDCIMVPLTSVIKDEPYSVTINQDNLSSGKLLKASRIRADKIFCVEKELVKKRTGRVEENSFQIVKKEMFSIF